MTRFERTFRLSEASDGIGLACQLDAGLSLAGIPLLRKTAAGFTPRPLRDLSSLMKAAYAEESDPVRLARGLNVVAEALNRGDIGRAMISALHMRLPDLDPNGVAGIANADAVLAKYNYNDDEPRDERGRWTTGGAAPPRSSAPRPSNAVRPERSWGAPTRLYGGRITPTVGPGGMGGNGPPPEFAIDTTPEESGKPRARIPESTEPTSPPLGYIPGDPNYPMNDGVRWPTATHDVILQGLAGKNPRMVIFVPLHNDGPVLTGPEPYKDYPCPEGYLQVRLFGIPQVTRPAGRRSFHAYDSVDEALELAKSKQFGTIFFNRAWSSLTNGEIRSRIQRDVVAVKLPGVDIGSIYHPVEILSPRQTKEKQERRMDPDPRIAPLRTRNFRESSYGRSPYFEYFDTPSDEA